AEHLVSAPLVAVPSDVARLASRLVPACVEAVRVAALPHQLLGVGPVVRPFARRPTAVDAVVVRSLAASLLDPLMRRSVAGLALVQVPALDAARLDLAVGDERHLLLGALTTLTLHDPVTVAGPLDQR